jgi:hypothetical protein
LKIGYFTGFRPVILDRCDRGAAAKAAFSILGLARLVITPSTPMDLSASLHNLSS